jgi:hypothetical protein
LPEQPAAIKAELAEFQVDHGVLQPGAKGGPPDLEVADLEALQRDAHLALKVLQHGEVDRVIEPVSFPARAGRSELQAARGLGPSGKIAVEIDAIALDIERKAGGNLVEDNPAADGDVPIGAR